MPGSYQVTPAILGRRRATQRITVTPASKPGRPTASYRVSPPPGPRVLPAERGRLTGPRPETLTQRPVIRDDRPGGARDSRPGFLLPSGHRRSLLDHPIPAEGLGPPHGRLTGHAQGVPGPRTGLPRSARTAATGVGALCPGDGGAHPDRGHFPAGTSRFAAASPYTPAVLPIDEDRA